MAYRDSEWEKFKGSMIIMAVILVVMLAIGYMVKSYGCNSRWPENKPSYGIGIGCMIEVDGKRIPEDRYRFMGE